MTDDALAPLHDLLELLNLSDAGGARTDEDIFVGSSQKRYSHRVFGGQVLAQSLIAGTRTVQASRAVHSLHGYFLRAGDADQPITFGVQRLRDGRSFSARRIHAYQNGEPILSMIASFQEPDFGIDHQDTIPEGIPDPESLPSAEKLLGHLDHPLARATFQRPFDIRHVGNNLYLKNADDDRRPYQAVWLKAIGAFPEDANLHRAALAFASDYTLLEPSLRPHGLTWTTPGMSVASLDHAMWWHRPVRVDDWLLYVAASPSASGARGLNIGKFFNREGVLVASVAQEGMIRVPEQLLKAEDGTSF
ncbi:acyl-CoA thioesterase [Psychromicrobium lacuslunae]|uniref:Acyl-CoA thioesterase 2 n=1 Tax=Psychromicrobium lacuslunae TaxID=1618207 RepID=A0A0D4BXY3_9MICC|nr:acyl-CoA thioesterase II [Psychromicrobium lacuslunae]AJT41159.1 acyl-CoA thioesterase [Psychromicrobium lacuslunae]